MSFLSWLVNRNSPQADTRGRAPAAPRKRAPFRPRLEALEGRDVPSTLTVTNNLDSGAGSLRAEIAKAHNGDTVIFAPSLDGQTITLTSGELDITKNWTIQIEGPGDSQLTVSGGGASRVFEVGVKAQLILSGLTIFDGHAPFGQEGGGVDNHGVLTVSNSTFSGNSAGCGGGIYNDFGATLTVSNSTFSVNSAGDGGGIYNVGTMTVSGCLTPMPDPISNAPGGNSATDGGGIYNVGTAMVSNSTLDSNSTVAIGGGIYNDTGATLTVSGCILSRNNAGGVGGAIYNDGTLTVSGCILSDNSAGTFGGGIYNDSGPGLVGTLVVRNSTFSGNTAGFDRNISGSYADGGGNTFS